MPTQVSHGDSDAVALQHSGRRPHETVAHSRLTVITDGPHEHDPS